MVFNILYQTKCLRVRRDYQDKKLSIDFNRAPYTVRLSVLQLGVRSISVTKEKIKIKYFVFPNLKLMKRTSRRLSFRAFKVCISFSWLICVTVLIFHLSELTHIRSIWSTCDCNILTLTTHTVFQKIFKKCRHFCCAGLLHSRSRLREESQKRVLLSFLDPFSLSNAKRSTRKVFLEGGLVLLISWKC